MSCARASRSPAAGRGLRRPARWSCVAGTRTGRHAGTPYTVRVRASTAEGDGDWSEEVTGTPTENPTPVPALPGAGAVGLGLLLQGAARRALRARGGR